jgi:hypothetical protein
MSSPVPRSDLITAGESLVDWDDLAGLDRIVALYQVGPNTVIADMCDSREVRITARFDRGKGRYIADFERRTTISAGGQTLKVWAQTPAYAQCTADDLTSCLEAAVIEVDRIPVY